MNAKKVQFNVNDSSRRVEALLARDMTFAGAPLLPSEEDLQPNKGLYLDCSILCLRIKFPKKQYIRHQNKMYAFIFSTLVTEVVNVFETVPALYDVKPEHNRLWGVF